MVIVTSESYSYGTDPSLSLTLSLSLSLSLARVCHIYTIIHDMSQGTCLQIRFMLAGNSCIVYFLFVLYIYICICRIQIEGQSLIEGHFPHRGPLSSQIEGRFIFPT